MYSERFQIEIARLLGVPDETLIQLNSDTVRGQVLRAVWICRQPISMLSMPNPIVTSEAQVWLNRAMEILWLLVVFLVPLAFLDPDYVQSEAVIAYLEVPNVALLRTLIGLMAIVWLIHRGLHCPLEPGTSISLKTVRLLPARWLA